MKSLADFLNKMEDGPGLSLLAPARSEQGTSDLAGSLLDVAKQGASKEQDLAASLLEALQQALSKEPDLAASLLPHLLAGFSKVQQGPERLEARALGGRARAAGLTPERRKEISQRANAAKRRRNKRRVIGFERSDGMPD